MYMVGTNNVTTTNLAHFGWRERKLSAELLTASCEQGFPSGFWDNEVTIMLNKRSGAVFFTNFEYQVAMLNEGKLESWYFTPYRGYEGFADELRDMLFDDSESWNSEDIEYLYSCKIISDEEYKKFI